MAAIMTKRGSQDNIITYEFMCESVEDMASIDRKYITLGSICIVVNDGAMDIYIADSAHEWHSLSIGASGGSSEDAGASLSIYICANNEVSNGLPNISEPDENTIYLVASGNTSGNLYEEYVYVNNAWEKFGAASIDLSNYATKSELPNMSLYAPKANPEFTGSISMGRTDSTGTGSTALGYNVEASGDYSHAEGKYTQAILDGAHAEGHDTLAESYYAHAEGDSSTADGDASHAEGYYTSTSAGYAHAEGYETVASGDYGAHAEGYSVEASGDYGAHAEGRNTEASGNYGAHAEGYDTEAAATSSHAEGKGSRASGAYSHAEGFYTYTSNGTSHAEGYYTSAVYDGAHSEGYFSSAAAKGAHAEGGYTDANGEYSHVGGVYNVRDVSSTINFRVPSSQVTAWTANTQYEVGAIVSNNSSLYYCKTAHTSGTSFSNANWNQILGTRKFIEIIGNGYNNDARANARALDWQGNEYLRGNLYVGCNSNSTGGSKVVTSTDPVFTNSISMGRKDNTTVGQWSTATGFNVTASGALSHAEGSETVASQTGAHAEGTNTTASNTSAHAEGSMTTASGAGAHAEGGGTFAGGDYSHAEGGDTVVNHAYQHAFGTYNNPDSSLATIHQKGTYIEIVGNGTAYNARSNARALDWTGNEYLKGDLYVGCNADSTGGNKVATESFVTTRVPAPPVADGTYNLQVVVSSGTATYSWVAAPGSASGVSF